MGMSGKRTSSTFICNVAATNQNGSEEKVVYIYGSPPPQGLPREGGNVSLPSVVLNTLKDMLKKHCKFQCFLHILLILFS